MRLRRSLNVIATVEAVRERHPELQRPLTVTSLRRVLEREDIAVARRPIRAYAFVEGGLGSFVIVLRSGLNPRHERRVLAHEYAHIKLHYQEAGEVVYQQATCRRGDPTEIEAQLFARMLEIGPDARPEHAELARFVAMLDASNFTRPLPQQLAFHLPEPAPEYKPPAERYGHGSHNDAAGEDAHGRRRRRGPLLLPAPHSPYFDWSKNGRPLGWFHRELGWVEVYDGMLLGREGRPRWVLLECGDRRAQRRLFIVDSDDRRDYWFAEGEKRSRAVDALAKQFDRSARVTRDRITELPSERTARR